MDIRLRKFATSGLMGKIGQFVIASLAIVWSPAVLFQGSAVTSGVLTKIFFSMLNITEGPSEGSYSCWLRLSILSPVCQSRVHRVDILSIRVNFVVTSCDHRWYRALSLNDVNTIVTRSCQMVFGRQNDIVRPVQSHVLTTTCSVGDVQ